MNSVSQNSQIHKTSTPLKAAIFFLSILSKIFCELFWSILASMTLEGLKQGPRGGQPKLVFGPQLENFAKIVDNINLKKYTQNVEKLLILDSSLGRRLATPGLKGLIYKTIFSNTIISMKAF
jgi:hypothetical protein